MLLTFFSDWIAIVEHDYSRDRVGEHHNVVLKLRSTWSDKHKLECRWDPWIVFIKGCKFQAIVCSNFLLPLPALDYDHENAANSNAHSYRAQVTIFHPTGRGKDPHVHDIGNRPTLASWSCTRAPFACLLMPLSKNTCDSLYASWFWNIEFVDWSAMEMWRHEVVDLRLNLNWEQLDALDPTTTHMNEQIIFGSMISLVMPC